MMLFLQWMLITSSVLVVMEQLRYINSIIFLHFKTKINITYMCVFTQSVKYLVNILLIFNAHKTKQILACGIFGARKHTIKNFPNDFHFLAEIM